MPGYRFLPGAIVPEFRDFREVETFFPATTFPAVMADHCPVFLKIPRDTPKQGALSCALKVRDLEPEEWAERNEKIERVPAFQGPRVL